MCTKEDIERKLTTNTVINSIRKRKEDCKNDFNVARPECREV